LTQKQAKNKQEPAENAGFLMRSGRQFPTSKKRTERIEPRTYSADASVDHTSIKPKRATPGRVLRDPVSPAHDRWRLAN
jgi:hypothetical protein